MRMWMIPSSCLCRKHLLGEHGEIHKAIGNLRHTGKWTNTLTDKGFLEPQNFMRRHNELMQEMIVRGYNHKSPLDVRGLILRTAKVDVKKSLRDLKSRCDECKFRIEKYLENDRKNIL